MWTGWLRQGRTWRWLCIALVLRGALFWVFLHEHGLHSAWWGWGAEHPDTAGYLDPVDGHLDGHAYRPDHRMPGYALPYWIFRHFTTVPGAGTLVILAQFLLGALSIMVLARTARLLGISARGQELICIGYALCLRVAVQDVFWMTESFCTSAMIIGVHGWIAHARTSSRTALLWAGAWMAWAVLLRPVQAAWLVLLAMGLVMLTRERWPHRAFRVVLFILPFLLADGLWVRRNAIMHGTFDPLSRGMIEPGLRNSQMYPVMRFMQAIGGNYVHWDPHATIRWFNMREGPWGAAGKRADVDVTLPRYALTPHLTVDSLHALADALARYSDPQNTDRERAALLRSITARCDRYITLYRREAPWQYHVMARLRLTGHLVERTGLGPVVQDPPHFAVHARPWFVALDDIEHWILVVYGSIAAIMAVLRRRRNPMLFGLGVLTLTGILLLPWGLRLCEGRYLVPFYPWLLVLIIAVSARAPMGTLPIQVNLARLRVYGARVAGIFVPRSTHPCAPDLSSFLFSPVSPCCSAPGSRTSSAGSPRPRCSSGAPR